MPGVTRVNLAIPSEHVPEIKRQIRVAKESIRSIRHSLTFNKVPKPFLIHLVFQAIKTLNHFPVNGSIYYMINPITIMTGESLYFKKNLDLQIRKYCQVHKEENPHNINHPCTRGAICMGPSENIQGRFKFISLRSMKNVTRKYWDMIPMHDTVIDRVNLLGKYKQEPLVFTDCKARLIGYGDVKLSGVYVDRDEDEAPLKIETENNIYYQEYQEEVHPEQEGKTIQQPIKVELDPLEEGPTIISQVPESIAPHTVQDMKQDCPNEIPGVCKS